MRRVPGTDPMAPDGAGPQTTATITNHEIPAYPDLAYRDVFWADRHYEDRADRIAIRRLLPPAGDRIVEIGAGYGRLANEYLGYREIVLLDASEAHVEAARAQFAGEPRISAVLGDAYHLPFEDGRFDTVVCVRVVHHLTDPGAVFREFARILRPDGVLVLEFANKRHLKAVARYALHRQCVVAAHARTLRVSPAPLRPPPGRGPPAPSPVRASSFSVS